MKTYINNAKRWKSKGAITDEHLQIIKQFCEHVRDYTPNPGIISMMNNIKYKTYL